MASEKLTDLVVKHWQKPETGRVEVWDQILPGFGIRITSNDVRSWVVMYRIGGGKRRLTLGNYPAMSLQKARKAARAALESVSEGKDPAGEKKAARQPQRPRDTVETVIAEFMTRHMEGKARAPRYIQETRRNFDLHVIPKWKGRDLAAIKRRDVLDLLDGIVDSGKPVAANRVLAAIRKLFNWSIQRGIIETSPVTLVEAPGAETERDRTLSDAEIGIFWQAAGELGHPFGSFFRIALLLAQRRTEIAGMSRQEIDAAAGTWTIPGDRTKNGRPHVVPLPYLARRIIAALPELGTHVFTTRNKRGSQPDLEGPSDAPISGFSKAKKDLDAAIARRCAAAGIAIPEPWTIHDLRRTASTGMSRAGTLRFVVERVLNHADQSVTGIYDRYEYLKEKRQALRLWSLHVVRIARRATKSPAGSAGRAQMAGGR